MTKQTCRVEIEIEYDSDCNDPDLLAARIEMAVAKDLFFNTKVKIKSTTGYIVCSECGHGTPHEIPCTIDVGGGEPCGCEEE